MRHLAAPVIGLLVALHGCNGDVAQSPEPDSAADGPTYPPDASDASLDASLDASFDAPIDSPVDGPMDGPGPDVGTDVASPDSGLPCADGTADCDPSIEGCETDITVEMFHCGACGAMCAALPNTSAAACEAGVCSISCMNDFADCNGSTGDGCESHSWEDLENCGSCGNACPDFPNADGVCSLGQCSATCNSGFADCNTTMSDGCEVSIATDLMNCGGCGILCEEVPQSTTSCVLGNCDMACENGFADCNAYLYDGCESEQSLDPNNCGACGIDCATGGCSSGLCLPASEIVATGLSYPQHMAIDAVNVYWSELPNFLFARPKAGGAIKTLVSGGAFVSEVSTDGANVYFFSNNMLNAVPVAGGPVTELAPMDVNLRTTSDGIHVYYMHQGDIRRVPVGGGVSEKLVTPMSVEFGLGNGWLYWLNLTSTIEGNLVGTSSSVLLAPVVNGNAQSFAVGGGRLVWYEYEFGIPFTESIRAIPIAGGTPYTLVSGEGPYLAVDSTTLYWGSKWGVSKKPLAGGSEAVIASDMYGPNDLSVDATHVYWLENNMNGHIARVSK